MKYLLIILLFASCGSQSVLVSEVGECVSINDKYVHFTITYNCQMPYKCIKTAYTRNTGGFVVGQKYILNQIKK